MLYRKTGITLCLIALSAASCLAAEPQALLKAAEEAFQHGQFQQAAAQWAAAAEAFAGDGDLANQARARAGLGSAHIRLSEHANATRELTAALALYTKIDDAAGQAACITNLAEVLFQQGSFDQSLEMRKKALALRSQTRDELGKAIDLVGIAQVYSRKGLRRDACDTYTEALAVFIDAGSSEGEAAAVSGLGIEYHKLGAYDMSLECHKHALEIHTASGNEFQQTRDFTNIGNVHEAASDYAGAIQHYAKALQIQERLKDQTGTAQSLANIGTCNKNLGRYGLSLQQLRRAAKIFQLTGNQSGLADCYTNIGVLFRHIGVWKQAETYHREALKIHEKLGDEPGRGAALSNLGVIHALSKDYPKALKLFEQAQKILEQTHDRKHAAIALFNAAAALTEMNKLKEAADKLDEAAAHFDNIKYFEGRAYCKAARASIEKKLGRVKSARRFCTDALELSRQSDVTELVCKCLGQLAGTMADDGDTEEALKMYTEMIREMEQLRRSVGTFQLASAFLSKTSDIYEQAVCLVAGRAKDDPEMASLAFHYMEMGRARSFLDMLVESGVDIREGADEQLLREERLLLAKMAAINTTINTERHQQAKPERLHALAAKLQDAQAEHNRLLIDLKERCPEYARLYYPEPLPAEQVRRALPADAILLQYSIGEKGSFLFALTREALQVYPLPDETTIRQKTVHFRQILMHRDSRGYCPAAFDLYRTLVQPAASLLQGKQHIIIVPDGPLHHLGFECLLTEETRKVDFARLPYLLRQGTVSYAPSATAWVEINRRPMPAPEYQKEILICADPDYGSRENEVQLAMRNTLGLNANLVRLPYSSLEARNVASVFAPQDTVLLDRRKASESRLKGMDLSVFKYLNFATHAVLDEERPEFSSIVLAQTDEEDDGFLQMQEIFNLKLNARLVSLSACSTACGKVLDGEGMVGISRAFFYAGTPSVVASLWNVNDASTSHLMTELFKSLKTHNLSTAAALRQAKLRLIEGSSASPFDVVPDNPSHVDPQASGSYSHPFYWAAFVLIGK
ncbi:MAG TPA: CHAT domain-containing tetratricopeptide repeat protein [Planctomycetota bacterium]|nr:CHAT domain-containing tetratricopeptide repeat protein [Planctomycetota bacterium]